MGPGGGGVSTVRQGPRCALDAFAAEVAHGIPHGYEAHHHHGDEHEEHVGGVNAHGVGIHNVAALAAAHADEACGLLQPAQQQAERNARHGAQQGYDAAFVEEDAVNLPARSAEVAQGEHVGALVDDEHGHRPDDVEAGHEEDEGEKEVGHHLLDVHDVEHFLLLLEAVVHGIARAGYLAELLLDLGLVGPVLEAQFETGDVALA